MIDLTPIDTFYKGYLFRIRLEARWAVFFDEMGWKWDYEVEGYKLPSGKFYLPDFYLEELGIYCEVKPVKLSKEELSWCIELSNYIKTSVHGIDMLLLEGKPSIAPIRTVVNGNLFVPVVLMHQESQFYPVFQTDEKNDGIYDLSLTINAVTKATQARFEREWREK